MPKLVNVKLDLKLPGIGCIGGTWEPDESEVGAGHVPSSGVRGVILLMLFRRLSPPRDRPLEELRSDVNSGHESFHAASSPA